MSAPKKGPWPEAECVTPDDRPPYSVRRGGHMPTHIVARDGFTIIATVNHDQDGIAEKLAAAEGLYASLCEMIAKGEGCAACGYGLVSGCGCRYERAQGAVAKAEGR